jgi:hypothetical protein
MHVRMGIVSHHLVRNTSSYSFICLEFNDLEHSHTCTRTHACALLLALYVRTYVRMYVYI